MLITLRLVHILTAVYWVGTILFMATFLEPVTRDIGPAAGPVMQGLQRRGYFVILPVVALVALVSGIGLLSMASGGFDPAWMRSGPGKSYSIGALAGIVAFLIGVLVMRPATMRMGATSAAAAQATDPAERDRLLATLPPLRARIRNGLRWTALLLVIAASYMAVGRYR